MSADFSSHLGNWTRVGLDQGYQQALWKEGAKTVHMLCPQKEHCPSLGGSVLGAPGLWSLSFSEFHHPGLGSADEAGAHPQDVCVRRQGESVSGPAPGAARDRRWRRRHGGRDGT